MNSIEIRNQLIEARDEYINLIKAELMGPGSEFGFPDPQKEIISSSPLSRYSVGILFPQGNKVGQDSDETVIVGEDSPEEHPEAENEEKEITVNTHKSDAIFDETADENLDEEIGMAAQYKPASMGMTFLAKGDMEFLKCSVEFATYRNALITDCIIPYEPKNGGQYTVPSELSGIIRYDAEKKAFYLLRKIELKEIREIFEKDTIPENEVQELRSCLYRMNSFLSKGYVRVPHLIEDITVSFKDGDYADNESTASLDGTNAKLVGYRTKISENIYSVTIMLVNDIVSPSATARQCIFQSKIDVNTSNNNFVFIENNPEQSIDTLDDEEKSLDLLYRKKKIYATGLGTSVEWNISCEGKGKIWTTFMPIKEIPAMSFSLPQNDTINDKELSMKYLSDLDEHDKDEKLLSMKKLVDLYYSWICDLKDSVKSLDERYKSAAYNNLNECEKACNRMYQGIETLKNSDLAYNAFVLANRAMFIQRVHIRKQGELFRENTDRYPDDSDISDWLSSLDYYREDDNNCLWRPFQIAFLLMDVNSVVFDGCDDRSIVDLIWFPTGGGKTEAYLGLTAFTIFYRRLAYENCAGGTAVIMRYTLRLLAAQQFTRAATLICACEFIRQDCKKKKNKYPKYSLGTDPITIGLWIGGTHIPNKNIGSDDSADAHLKKLINISNVSMLKSVTERHNKFQVLKCPWCGTKMVKGEKNNKLYGAWGYAMNGKSFYMFCPHEDCDFTRRLPIQIIDEELYEAPPSLLFGTVDKFAMMAWEGKVGNFFGVQSQNRSPELIIQDELHLISGALGTMVGLYETAVDGLASMKGVKPKIIASTATIRRAKEQCSVLYNREVVQFPAPGLDAEDSFFAKEDIIDYSIGKYGRKYVGIMPSGRTKAMIEIRSMAALLQKAYTMNLPDEVRDKIWTLTVYFNSLKDLGKASTLVDDDVKDFIIRTANRMYTTRRLIVNADELTSRISTTDLNETLDKLEKIEYSKENISNRKYASNILLATNMISVGIDVARLNVMLMVGQPKLTSEYIQASSRIGRSYPGVAFIQYDSTKSRDRSHYESFRAYHDSFYRFVEPTGATPFSKPARERALHAVVATLIRQKESLTDDGSAKYFNKNAYEETINSIKKYLIDRVDQINNRSGIGTKDDLEEIRSEIDEFVDLWQELVNNAAQEDDDEFVFGRKYMVTPPDTDNKRLLRQYNSAGKDNSVETLTSMRNVDISVRGSVNIWEDQ